MGLFSYEPDFVDLWCRADFLRDYQYYIRAYPKTCFAGESEREGHGQGARRRHIVSEICRLRATLAMPFAAARTEGWPTAKPLSLQAQLVFSYRVLGVQFSGQRSRDPIN